MNSRISKCERVRIMSSCGNELERKALSGNSTAISGTEGKTEPGNEGAPEQATLSSTAVCSTAEYVTT